MIIHLVTLGERKTLPGVSNCASLICIIDLLINIRDHLYHFEANRKKGTLDASLLIIPSGTWKEQIMENRMASLKKYVNQHAEDWCKYYTSQSTGQMIPKGSLKMVTACYTSKVWELATYSNKQSVREKQIYAKLFKDQEDRDLYRWESSHGVAAKTGPSTMEMEDDRAVDQNQCVALEVHSIQINRRVVDTAFRSLIRTMSSLSIRGSRRSIASHQ